MQTRLDEAEELTEAEKGDIMEKDLTILSVMCLQDPLRNGVPKAIKTCDSAHVTVIMCTGDQKETACAISIKAGIIKEGDQHVNPAN